MNIQALCHIPKSNYAYAYKENELHIRLRTARDDVDQVGIIFGHKFNWKNSREKHAMRKILSDAYFDYYQYEINTADFRLGYYFELVSGGRTLYYTEPGIAEHFNDAMAYCCYFQYPYINIADVHRIPAWTKDAVFYQIFVERFFNGNVKNSPPDLSDWNAQPRPESFFGGDLQGIIDKLDYLSDLGVNGIYLTPIFKSPSNHKYDITDYFEIDPYFGDKDIFKKLVDRAHEKGIKIVLDAVFNQCGDRFPPFLDVMEKGKASEYFDWFHIHGDRVSKNPPNYETFGYCGSMPKLNTANPELKKYLLDSIRYWTGEFHIDGWRLDVSDEVDHKFWREFREVLKGMNKDAVIIGENWHNALPWLMGDQFDSVMNYPVTKLCLDFFAGREITAKAFEQQLGACLMRYSDQVNEAMLNLLDSHDTERFLYSAGGRREALKNGAAFLFAYKGIPCTYYGTEIGMTGGYDPGCRRGFDWRKENWDMELYELYKRLNRIRREEKALKYGALEFMSTEELFVMKRSYEKETVVVIINATECKQVYNLDVPIGASVTELLSGKVLNCTEKAIDLELPPDSAFYMKLV